MSAVTGDAGAGPVGCPGTAAVGDGRGHRRRDPRGGRVVAERLKARYVEHAEPWFALGVPGSIRLGAVGPMPGQAGAVVLVEGWSDLAAVEVLVTAREVDLASTAIISMGGVTNVGHLMAALAEGCPTADIAVLCDAAELDVVRQAAPAVPTLACHRDLEGELIRAAGTDMVVEVLHAMGDGRGLTTFRRQPSQLGVPLSQGLHRFLGIRSGRKIVAARELTARLEAEGSLPPVLAELLMMI